MMPNAVRRAAVLAGALAFVITATADYDAGQRAWEAGHPGEALAQWREAADEGDRRAMLALGRLFVQGLGAPQDYVEAHKWFNLAASRGEAEAAQERDTLAGKMTPAQVAAAQVLARAWKADGTRVSDAQAAAKVLPTTSPSSDQDVPPPRAIRDAQRLLVALGYEPGPVDGMWGPRTGRAFRTFLGDAGLPLTEVLTPQSLRTLRSMGKRHGAGTVEESPAAIPDDSQASPAPQIRPNALHRAAKAGDTDGLRTLIATGADVNARDAQGWTPLMHVANTGFVFMAPPLLASPNIDLNIRAPDGATALFIATLHGHAVIVAQLLHAGADPSVKGPKGLTLLDLAQRMGHLAVLELAEFVELLQAEKTRRETEAAAQRAEADSRAFSEATALNARQAYEDYLSSWCPHGEHCDTARARLDDSVKASIAGKGFRGTTSEGGTQSYRFLPSGEFTGRHLHPGIFSALLPIPNTMSGTWHVDQSRIQMHGTTDGMVRWTAVAEWEGEFLVVRFADGGYDRLTESPEEYMMTESANTQESRSTEANNER